MKFEIQNSIMFSDTAIPDLFIANYMPTANGDFSKVYIYSLFLAKNKKDINITDLSNRLSMDISKIKQALEYWEDAGIILKQNSTYTIVNLKEKEMLKSYKPLITNSSKLKETMSENKERLKVVNVINNSFFQGIMSPSWFTTIDEWFQKYKFDTEVMYALFKYCFDKKALSKNYISTVAESWYNKGIKTFSDLDNYFMAYEKVSVIKKKICKALGITNRKLTSFEESYIDTWVLTYNYDFDIIKLALKKTTSKANPNFDYINAILKKWYNANLKTPEDIEKFTQEFKQTQKLKSSDVITSNYNKNNDKVAEIKHYNKNQDIDYSKYYSNLQ